LISTQEREGRTDDKKRRGKKKKRFCVVTNDFNIPLWGKGGVNATLTEKGGEKNRFVVQKNRRLLRRGEKKESGQQQKKKKELEGKKGCFWVVEKRGEGDVLPKVRIYRDNAPRERSGYLRG